MNSSTVEEKVRELLSSNNVVRPPVPVALIANNAGIFIREAPTGTNISGALIRSGGFVYIAVNNAHHANRQRFTIAHELAHYYLEHIGTDVHVDGDFTIKRDEKSSTATDDNEILANQFAAQLLMPTQFLVRDVTDLMPLDQEKIKRLGRKYQVSEQAMTIRLTNLGFLSPT
jgi:Zn-dependent peptidase ImmA (M78 family)